MNINQIVISIITLVILNWLWDQRIKRKKLALEDFEKPDVEIIERRKKLLFSSRVILTPILAFPLIMGLLFTNKWFETYNMASESSSWDEVNGVVIDKKVHTIIPGGSKNTSTKSYEYLPLIEYEYHINGKTFTSKRINYHQNLAYTETDDVQLYLDEFPNIGEKITVYTTTVEIPISNEIPDSVITSGKNSKAHQLSVLVPGIEGMNYLSLVLTNIFTLLGLVGFKKLYL